MDGYDIAQICLNGHLISRFAGSSPERRANACPECGAKTILQCQECNALIRGNYHVDFVIGVSSNFVIPKHCHNCGAPYPWTRRSIEAMKKLLEEEDALDEESKGKALEAIPDLIANTPSTPLAEARWKKVLSKVTKSAGEGLRTILIEVATEAVKKSLGLGQP